MTKKELIKELEKYDDDIEIFVRNHVNPVRNITKLERIKKPEYGCFGKLIDCLIVEFD